MTMLSGPAQGSRSLRPAGLHAHPKWTDFPEASTGAVASTYRSGSYRDKPEIARTELSSVGSLRPRGALPNVGVGSSAIDAETMRGEIAFYAVPRLEVVSNNEEGPVAGAEGLSLVMAGARHVAPEMTSVRQVVHKPFDGRDLRISA